MRTSQTAARGGRMAARVIASPRARSQVETLDHSRERGNGVAEGVNAWPRDTGKLSRPSAGHGEWVGDPERDEALVGKAREGGMDGTDGCVAVGAALDLVLDCHAVGAVAELVDGGQYENLELAEEVAFGHAI